MRRERIRGARLYRQGSGKRACAEQWLLERVPRWTGCTRNRVRNTVRKVCIRLCVAVRFLQNALYNSA